MPITIREILASDTISGAADKINFNFDQLLLNGGGPAGPVGPQGPIGPIGGRGIRGSVWYEGIGDPNQNPNVNPPTLTPEDEDNYLQSNGEVWSYSASAGQWFPASINLTGPIGPAGTSGKFSEYRVSPYDQAGDTTMYPNPMTFSQNGLNEGVRAVIIGGLPSGIVPGSGNGFISSTLAQSLVQPDVSLLVHQFASNQGGIKFHGGRAADNFTDNISHLSSIRLSDDDILVIDVPKPAGVIPEGLRVLTGQRGQLFQAGKEIRFQTGNTTVSIPGSNSFIVEAQRAGGGDDPTIQLNVVGTSVLRASLRLGGTGITPPLAAQTGDARLDAGLIVLSAATTATMSGGQQSNIYAGTQLPAGSNGRVTIGGSAAILAEAPLVTLKNTSPSGQTNIYAGTQLPAGAVGRVTIGARNEIVLKTDDTTSVGRISLETGVLTAGDIAIKTGQLSTGDIAIKTGQSSTGDIILETGQGSIGGNIRIATGAFAPGGDIDITTDTGTANGGEIRITSRRAIEIEAKAIPVQSSGTVWIKGHRNGGSFGSFGSIRLESIGTNAAPIVLTTAASSNTGINLITGSSSTGGIFVSTADGSGTLTLQAKEPTGASTFPLPPTAPVAISISTVGATSGHIKVATADNSASNIGILTGTGSTGSIVIGTSQGTGAVVIAAGTGGISQIATGGDISLSATAQRVSIAASSAAPSTSEGPKFKVDANNHYVHSTQITGAIGGPNVNIFSSGLYTPTVAGFTNVQISWQRVGNVVSGAGRMVKNGGGTILTDIPYPIKGGANITIASGIVQIGSFSDAIGVEASVGGQNLTIGVITVILLDSQVVRFSFSYVIA